MRTLEAILKRFWNKNIMLILRALNRGRRVRIYDKGGKEINLNFAYVDVCITEDDKDFLKEAFPDFYDAINGYNHEKSAKKQTLGKLYA